MFPDLEGSSEGCEEHVGFGASFGASRRMKSGIEPRHRAAVPGFGVEQAFGFGKDS